MTKRSVIGIGMRSLFFKTEFRMREWSPYYSICKIWDGLLEGTVLLEDNSTVCQLGVVKKANTKERRIQK